MTKEKIFIELEKIFREVLNNDILSLQKETNAEDIDEWDSLTNIQLILAQENKFGIRYDLGQISDLKNIGELVDLIHGHISDINE